MDWLEWSHTPEGRASFREKLIRDFYESPEIQAEYATLEEWLTAQEAD